MTTSEHADLIAAYDDAYADAFVREPGSDGGLIEKQAHEAGILAVAALASTQSPAQPTEANEREALAKILAEASYGDGHSWDAIKSFGNDGPFYARADAILAAGFRLAPSPVQGADDRLAQAEIDLAKYAVEHDHPEYGGGWFFSPDGIEDLIATYQQSPQAALNEVRAEHIEYSWDDRKTLLDVYYNAGGKVGEGLSLREDIYDGLIAVANLHAAPQTDGMGG